jgi:hypothetical protein
MDSRVGRPGTRRSALFADTASTPEAEEEAVRLNGDRWEPCAFSLDGHEFGVLRGDDSIPSWIPLSGIGEVLVHHGPDGAITELDLRARDDRQVSARVRSGLVEVVLSRAWEAGATITASAEIPSEQPLGPSQRRHQNF